jgi:hypothetical protein
MNRAFQLDVASYFSNSVNPKRCTEKSYRQANPKRMERMHFQIFNEKLPFLLPLPVFNIDPPGQKNS